MNKKILTLKTVILIVLVGCVSDPALLENRTKEFEQLSQGDADKFFIVDCLLPGQIRQLGSKITYLTARRPIKTSAGDCQIRGGEYVAFDRANYATSLRIWLPRAQVGDAEAQTNVGEIYEKGLGMTANHKTAAEWYRKAATQGNSRAQINLGYLYEKGLGVPKDLNQAMDWYQKASGLEAKDIPYAATINTASDNELQEEVKLLKNELSNTRKESQALTLQLSELQKKMNDSQQRLQQDLHERDEAQSRLNKVQAQGNAAEQARLENILFAKNEDLKAQQQRVSTFENQYKQDLASLSVKLEETEKRARQVYDQLKSQQSIANDAQLKLVEAEAKLAKTERQLLELQQKDSQTISSVGKTMEEMQLKHQESIQKIQGDLATSESERQKSMAQIAQLQSEKQQYEAQIKSLQNTASSVASLQKPVIEIIDPPFVVTRGMPTITLRSIVKERDVIGKASSAAGIMSVMVNDVKNEVDDRGIFTATVGIKGEKTSVKVVAVDRNGARESLDFLLSLEGAENDYQRNIEENGQPDKYKHWKNIQFGNYFALIIGNNKYQKIPSLDTPKNDARAIDQLLRDKYGFKTQLLIDANRYEILSAMNKLRGQLTETDNLIIYYAGHGELDQVNMRGHWLPVDADADNTANWISTVAITDILNSISANHILVVADSCYSGAMTRSSLARLDVGMSQEKKSEWLKAMLKARSRTVLTSGGLKPVMDGGGGEHSVFAQAFIKALKNNNSLLEGQELYRNVSANIVAVAAKYGVEQVPRYAPVAHSGHEAGEFFFVPKGI